MSNPFCCCKPFYVIVFAVILFVTSDVFDADRLSRLMKDRESLPQHVTQETIDEAYSASLQIVGLASIAVGLGIDMVGPKMAATIAQLCLLSGLSRIFYGPQPWLIDGAGLKTGFFMIHMASLAIYYSHLTVGALFPRSSTFILSILLLGRESSNLLPLNNGTSVGWYMMGVLAIVFVELLYTPCCKYEIEGPRPPAAVSAASMRGRSMAIPYNRESLSTQIFSSHFLALCLFTLVCGVGLTFFWETVKANPPQLPESWTGRFEYFRMPPEGSHLPNVLLLRTLGMGALVTIIGIPAGLFIQAVLQILALTLPFAKISFFSKTAFWCFWFAYGYSPALVIAALAKYFGYSWIGLFCGIHTTLLLVGAAIGKSFVVHKVSAQIAMVAVSALSLLPAIYFWRRTPPNAAPPGPLTVYYQDGEYYDSERGVLVVQDPERGTPDQRWGDDQRLIVHQQRVERLHEPQVRNVKRYV